MSTENTFDMLRVTREQLKAAEEIWEARRAELGRARHRVDELREQLNELTRRAFEEDGTAR